ncbi:MAG TPA: peptidoglycan DD-metalloendopeptidase family protein [Thermoanaerobaculia bacterium]
MRACIALAIVLFSASLHAADAPQQIVERFYTAYIAAKPAGLPDGEDLERLKPFLSDRLYASIVDALKYRDEMTKRHPDEKPPFVDGDHFTSVFEGPRSFKVLRTEGENVRVRFTDAPDVTWEDVIVVKDGRIDDVIYGGAGEFNPSGRLSDRLKYRDEEAAVTVTVSPQPAYVSADASGQSLSVDLLVENHTQEPLDLDEVHMSVYDRADKLVLRRFIDGNGTRPSIRTADVREVPAGATALVFNPFHDFAPEVDLHTVRFDLKLSSKDGSRRHTASAAVKPEVYRGKARLILPIAGRMIVYDGHDFLAHHRRWDYTIPGLRQLGFRTNFMRYSYDFVPVDESGNSFAGAEEKNESWFGFGQPVRAVADGTVAAVVDTNPDDRKFDPASIVSGGTMKVWGNYVVLDHGQGEFSVYGHIRQGSSRVKAGQQVRRGDAVAAIGASGSSMFPHLHYELQTAAGTDAEGLPSLFEDFDRILGSKRVTVKSGRVNSGDIVQARK